LGHLDHNNCIEKGNDNSNVIGDTNGIDNDDDNDNDNDNGIDNNIDSESDIDSDIDIGNNNDSDNDNDNVGNDVDTNGNIIDNDDDNDNGPDNCDVKYDFNGNNNNNDNCDMITVASDDINAISQLSYIIEPSNRINKQLFFQFFSSNNIKKHLPHTKGMWLPHPATLISMNSESNAHIPISYSKMLLPRKLNTPGHMNQLLEYICSLHIL